MHKWRQNSMSELIDEYKIGLKHKLFVIKQQADKIKFFPSSEISKGNVDKVIEKIETVKSNMWRVIGEEAAHFLLSLERDLEKRKQEFRRKLDDVMDDPYKMGGSNPPEYLDQEDRIKWKEIQGKLNDVQDAEKEGYGFGAIADAEVDSGLVGLDKKADRINFVKEHAYKYYDLQKDVNILKKSIEDKYIIQEMKGLDVASMRIELESQYQEMEKIFDEMKYSVSKEGLEPLSKRCGMLQEKLYKYEESMERMILKVLTAFSFGLIKDKKLAGIKKELDRAVVSEREAQIMVNAKEDDKKAEKKGFEDKDKEEEERGDFSP